MGRNHKEGKKTIRNGIEIKTIGERRGREVSCLQTTRGIIAGGSSKLLLDF